MNVRPFEILGLDIDVHHRPGVVHVDQGSDLGLSMSVHVSSIGVQVSSPAPLFRGLDAGQYGQGV